MDRNPTPEILEKFVCQRCNACCKKPGFVYLKEGEADHIAKFLKLDVYEFTQKYCDIQDRMRLVLKKQQSEACVFLSGQGCRVHEVKPQQCADFPVRWRTENSFDYCVGLKKILDTRG